MIIFTTESYSIDDLQLISIKRIWTKIARNENDFGIACIMTRRIKFNYLFMFMFAPNILRHNVAFISIVLIDTALPLTNCHYDYGQGGLFYDCRVFGDVSWIEATRSKTMRTCLACSWRAYHKPYLSECYVRTWEISPYGKESRNRSVNLRYSTSAVATPLIKIVKISIFWSDQSLEWRITIARNSRYL